VTRRTWRKWRVWLAMAMALGLLLLGLTPLRHVFDRSILAQWLCDLGHWAFVGFIIAYTVLTAIGIPGTLLTIAGGAVFGLAWGTLVSLVGATLGAMGAFWVARYLLRHRFQRWCDRSQILERFDRAVRRYPWTFVFVVRFAPISPFNLTNFLFGLTSVHWVPYSLGTLFGIVPGTLAYTWLGVTGQTALSGGDRLPFLLALGALVLLSLILVCFRHRSCC